MMTKACLVVFLAAFVVSDYVGADLIALYQFEGDFGDSTGSFDATELDVPEFSDDSPEGPGQALMTSGRAGGRSGLNCGNVSGDGDDLSVAFWLKEGLSNSTYSVCLSKQQISEPFPDDPIGFSVLMRSSAEEAHSIHFRIGAWQSYGGWGPELKTTTDVFGTDRWAHFVFTYDDETDTANAYVDGELNATMTGIKERGIGGAANKEHDLTIGRTQEPFQGLMDDVALFDHVLTEDEVLDIFDGSFDAYFSPEGIQFVRGDCNEDGEINISDGVCILNWLFVGTATPGCVAATNTNGDDAANISDATYLLNHLFSGGPAPVAPFPDCGPGTLPADTTLGCADPPDCQ